MGMTRGAALAAAWAACSVSYCRSPSGKERDLLVAQAGDVVTPEIDSQDLQTQMEFVRQRLRINVDEVVRRARSYTNWRTILGRHPWITIATAGTVGYFLAPRSRGPSILSPPQLAGMPQPHNNENVPQPQLMNRVLATMAAGAVKVGMNVLGQYLRSEWERMQRGATQSKNELSERS